MFEYNNETYTLESLQKGAEEQGLEFDAYLKGMMNLGMKEIKGDSSQGDVTVKDENMASNSEDGSLVYEFRTEGDKSAWGKSTDGGVTFDVVDGGNIPDEWFKDPKFMKAYNNLGFKASDFKSEKPSKASTLFSNLGLGFIEFGKGFENIKEGVQLGIAELLMPGEMSGLEKKIALQTIRKTNVFGSSESYDPIISKLEENIPEYETQSITEDLQKGNYAQAGFRTVNAALRSAPSLVAAATGVGGLIALGSSVAGNKFEEEFEADPEKSTGILLANASITGATEATFELVTRGLLKRAGFLKDAGRVKEAKEVIKGGVGSIVKNIGFGLTAEGSSEAATELTVAFEDYIMLDRKIPTKDLIYRLGDSFIVGSFIGGGISSVGEVTKTMPNAKNRAEAILMPENAKKQISKKAEELNELIDDLPSVSPEGKNIVNEKISEIENEIIDIKKQSSLLINNLKDESLAKYAKNIKDINEVKIILNKAKTDSETKIAEQKYKTLQEENISILNKAKGQAAARVTETVKEQIKKGGLDGNIVEMTSEEISNIKEEGFDSKTASGEFGFIKQFSDGSFEIILNKDKPMVGTAAHEFMHAVLFKTIGANSDIQNNLGDALIEHVSKLGGDASVLGKRLTSYGKFQQDGTFVRDDNFGEETITIMSESIVDGSLKFEENFFTKIGDIVRRFSQNYLGKEITFDSGKDVYNFVKDYSKSIKDGKINKAILEIAKKGAKGKLVEGKVKPEDAVQMSKDASDNVQRIYEDRGDAGAFDIIEAFKPITSKIVQRRSEAPNFDRELLTSEIEIGKRGILDLIREYNVDSGVPLAAYINKFLPARAIEASKRVLGEEFTTDITERVDVAAEEVTQQPTKPKKKKIVLADRLGVTDKVSKAINKIVPNLELDKLNFKTLKNKVPVITGDLFGISPKKIENLANLTKKELQSAQMFINKNADLLISMLPEGATASGTATGVPNTLLKAFYTKVDRAKMAKTGSKAGLAVQQKNNINKTDFLETFGIIDGKPDRTDRNTSARVLALANLTGKMITNQAVRSELAKLKVNDKAINKIAEGKSQVMFSKDANAFNIDGTIDNLLGVHAAKVGRKTFKLRTEEDVDLYIEALISDVLPLMPRAFWFGKEEGVSDTGSEFTPSDRVIDIPKSRKQERKDLYVYYKQQVNALNQLPEDAFGSSIGVTDFSRPSYNGLFEGKKGVQVDKIKETNKRTAKIHEALWSRIYDAIQENPSKAATIGNYFKLVSKQNNHWHRAAAEIIGYSPSPKGTAKKLYEYEHAMPASASYLYLIDGALKGYDFKSIYNPVMDNFKLIALDAAENKKLNEAGLADRMPEGWNTTDNKWWERYFNDKVDIDSESIVTLDGKTFKQEFNIVQLKPDLKNNVKFSKAMSNSRVVKDPKGITVLDFDDTLATTKSLVKFTTPDGKTGTLNAEQFASTYEDLQDQGYTFDFSDFNKVVKGKLAPLFNKAIKLQGKFGPENMFVLTARPPQAQKAIFDFLKANGLNIPIKNITGLGNSTAEAKALWMADKVADGYNDFYFADDALQNVQAVKNMLDQFDVKSKVQQAKIKFSKDASGTFNDIIQETTGVESQKVFSEAQAKIRGAKSKYKSIVPPSAQDFAGLLYNFLGKGKKGEQDMAFFKKALIDPFARGINELNAARQASANDYENLLKQFPEVKKLLNKKIEGTDYTHDQAVRIYLWNKAGFEIPGLSKRDLNSVVDFVENNSKVQAFADTIGLISKKEDGYSAPGDYWLAENIKSDLLSDGSIGDARAEFLAEWQQNADLIFSPENLNKIEAIYGSKFREALEDMLYRMKTGRNRPAGGGRLMNVYTNWVNNSVGAIMFLNMRSALLQTISATNYINWSDNNPLKAAAAFANQKQYWSDFSYLFNSDYLKQRRSGNQRGINEAELSAAVAGAENKAKAAIAWLLKKGFLPTQIADSFAIASGGATFYRNRIKALVKEGMTQEQAEKQAFLDFQETTEVAQQSARPDMISQQQASPLGKLILAFQNTPMQYARIMNKAARDIYNGRGDYKTHTSKIIYYGFVQSIIFGALQSALFASLDDEDEEKFDKKKERILNGMIDSVLSGIGYGGKAISTMKNTLTTFLDQRKRGFNADHTYTILQLLGFSPPIGSKLRKVYSSIQTDKFNKDVFKRRGFTLDNPIWSAVGNVVEGVTNVPLGRFSQKMLNIDNALDANNKWWQRTALVLGWNTWDLGIKDADIEDIKKEIKKEKKVETKEKTRIKREEKKKEKEEENKSIIEENKKKSKKDGLCSAVSKGGKRCKKKAINGGMCTIHEKAVQRKDGKQTQCIKRKSNGKRCGMKTSSKSGLCYYHD